MTLKVKPSVSKAHQWTPELLKALPIGKLMDLRSRALKFGAEDLVSMCDIEESLRSTKPAKPTPRPRPKGSDVVIEYHFVCASNRGVIEEADGTFRTGSWVVSEGRVQASLKHGAIVALHESRAEPSYRQGALIGYRLTQRDMIDKDNVGIEFHVRPGSIGALRWVGDATGEKGYRYV